MLHLPLFTGILLCFPRHSLFKEENLLSKYFLTSANELFALRSSLFPLLEDSEFDVTDGEGEREREMDFEAFPFVCLEDMASRYPSMHLRLVNKQAVDVWPLDSWTDYLYCHYCTWKNPT